MSFFNKFNNHFFFFLLLSSFVNFSSQASQEDLEPARANSITSQIRADIEPQPSEEVQRYRHLIDQGDINAYYQLGNIYFEGRVLKKDRPQAAQLYYEAALKGHKEAQCALAWMYENGHGMMYTLGSGIEKNDAHAIYWYREAALQDCKVGQRNLAKLLIKELRFSDALPWLEKAANQNDPEAQFDLGVFWTSHIGQQIDTTLCNQKAYDAFSGSAWQGNLKAQCYQGIMMIMGRGTDKDEESGSALCLSASNEGCIEAQFCMGVIYAKGLGMPRNQIMSLESFEKGGEKNFHLACDVLRRLYEDGTGVPQDDEKASFWSRKSSNVDTDTIDNILEDFYYKNLF